MPDAQAETTVLELIIATTAACNYRWSVRLPMRRPGSDFRRYEAIYTYALITAMAVEKLQQHASEQDKDPAQSMQLIMTEEGIQQLQDDPIVWEDWLGYFEQADIGGLYQVATCKTRALSIKRTIQAMPRHCAQQHGEAKQRKPKGAGRAMLAAIAEGIQDGSLTYNHPGDLVQVDRQGRTFLEHPAILHWCIERLELNDEFKRVKNRFDRQTVFRRSSNGQQLFRGKLRARDQIKKGYVVEEGAQLWQTEPPVGRFVIEKLTQQNPL